MTKLNINKTNAIVNNLFYSVALTPIKKSNNKFVSKEMRDVKEFGFKTPFLTVNVYDNKIMYVLNKQQYTIPLN